MARPYFGGTLEIELHNKPDVVIPWSDVARLREDLDELSDDSLIGLVKGGSADAFAVLFERYRQPAHRLAAYYSNSVDAKDIVAESFTQVYQQLRRGHGPETSFRGYLLTAVRREAGRRAKMRKRDTPTDDIAAIDKSVPFGNGAVDGFERDLIQKAFATLPQRWQKVLWHLDVDGRKPREVAPMLGMKPNSVSALAYRAREGLRKAYLEQHILAKGESLGAACQEVRRRLVAFVRASANKSDATKVESHLKTCSSCTSAYHEIEELNSHIGAVSGVLALSFAAPMVAGPWGGAAGGVAGHLGGLTAKATLFGKVAAAAGSTAAAMITSMTVVNIPLQLPADAQTVHAQPFAAKGQHETDRTIGPVADGTLGRSVSSQGTGSDTTGAGQDQAAGGEPGQNGQGQTPGSDPSQGSSSGGSRPVTVTVNGTKTTASVNAAGVKVDASVDIKKPLETRVTVKAGNLEVDTDKVTKKVNNKVNKVTEKVSQKVTEKPGKDRDAD